MRKYLISGVVGTAALALSASSSPAYEFDQYGDVSGSFEHWEIKDGKITPVTVFVPK